MPNINQNISNLYSGRTSIINITILDQNGNPYSLAGGAAWWSFGQGPGLAPIVSKNTGNGGIVLINNSGTYTAQITLNPQDTVSISGGPYYHELVVQDQFGDVVTTTTGFLTFIPALQPY